MTTNEKLTQQENPAIAVRVGPLRAELDAHCARFGLDRSEFIRQALAKSLTGQSPYDPRALCAGAARAFENLVDAACRAGLINPELAGELTDKVAEFGDGMEAALQKKFAKLHPEAIAFERKRQKKIRAWKKAGMKGKSPFSGTRREREHRARRDWNRWLELHSQFPDLERAEGFIQEDSWAKAEAGAISVESCEEPKGRLRFRAVARTTARKRKARSD